MVNRQRVISLTRKLISIDSQNPPGNESKIARWVKDYLEGLGLKARLYEFKPDRPNVVAHLRGSSREHSLLITPHLDTVPASRSWRYQPFKAEIRAGRLYGLGATDCKGNLACALEAIKSLVEERHVLGYNLIFAATADEESGSGLGLVPLLGKGILRPCLAVVLDADAFNIIVAQKGLLHLKLKVTGKSSHGAYPWQGINAIDHMLSVLQGLKRQRFRFRSNSYLRPPTLNIGTIRGGDKVNVVADWCEVELDFRFLPGMSEQKILRSLEKIAGRFTRRFKIELSGIQRPYSINKNHPLVAALYQSLRRQGIRPKIKGSEGATVITFFQDKGIPAVATGFGCPGCAHSADEYIKTDNLYRGALALENFLRDFTFKED